MGIGPEQEPSAQDGLVSLGAAPSTAWRVDATRADLVRPQVPPRAATFPAGAKTVTVDLARSAMIVVDMQNDFCHPDGWLAAIGVDIAPARAPIAPLARLLPVLRAARVPVVYVNWGNRPDRLNLSPALLHVYDPTGRGIGLGGALPANGAKVLEFGSWAAAVVDELRPEPGDVEVAKYRMSGFPDTPLESILRTLGVGTLFFGGVNADQCVLATLMDANFRGFDTIMLEDCSGTTSPDFCRQATVYNVRQCFGFVASSADLLAAVAASP